LWDELVGLWATGLGPTGDVLRDVSGFSNDGSFVNITPGEWGVGDTVGYNLDFERSDNDYITVASSNALRISTSHSYSWWGTIESNPNFISPLMKGNYADAGSYGCLFYNSGPGEVWAYANGNNYVQLSPVGSLASGSSFRHWAITYDGITFRLYENGVETDSDSSVNQTFTANTEPLSLGINDGGGGNQNYGWDGKLANWMLWDRTLTPSEIQQLYVDSLAPLRTKRTMAYSVEEVVGLVYPIITRDGIHSKIFGHHIIQG
jgi:hypothetical protein